MEEEILHRPDTKPLCPFVIKPFENCYCTSTSSLHSEATIHYCGGNFEKCEIYASHLKGEA